MLGSNIITGRMSRFLDAFRMLFSEVVSCHSFVEKIWGSFKILEAAEEVSMEELLSRILYIRRFCHRNSWIS